MNGKTYADFVEMAQKWATDEKDGKKAKSNFAVALSVPRATELPRRFYVGEKDIDAFLSVWLRLSAKLTEKKGHALYLNNTINKGVTGCFKFFLDMDFKGLQANRMTTDMVFRLFADIAEYLEELYSTNVEMHIWGRDVERTEQYRFHLHFPSIIVNKARAKILVDMLIEHFLDDKKAYSVLFGERGENMEDVFDAAPFSSGIRWKGCKKIIPSENYAVIEGSEYLPFDFDTREPFIDQSEEDAIRRLHSAMIDVNSERIMATPCEEVDIAIRDVSRETGRKLAMKMTNSETEDLASLINNEIYNGEEVVFLRNRIDRYIVFDTKKRHVCPVNPEKTHGRENMYATIRADGVYLHCFRECGEPIRIVEYNIADTFVDPFFEMETLFALLEAGNVDMAMGYTNRFFCIVAESNASRYFKLMYGRKDPTRIKTCKAITEQTLKIEIRCPFLFDGRKLDFFSYWTSSPKRKIYSGGLVYCPLDKTPERAINMFPGFAMEDDELRTWYNQNNETDIFKRDIDMAFSHVRYFWCGREAGWDAFFWCMKWLAFLVQNPFSRAETTPCLVGEEGSGKSGWFHYLIRPFFKSAYHVITNPELLTTWTTELENRCLIVYDEAALSDKKVMNSLKSNVTRDQLEISRKFHDTMARKNTLSFVAITQDVGNITSNSRRFLFLHTTDNFKGSTTNDVLKVRKENYFKRLFEGTDWRNVVSYLKFGMPKVRREDFRTLVPTYKTFSLKVESERSITVKFLLNRASSFESYETDENEDVINIETMRGECKDLFRANDVALSGVRRDLGQLFPQSMSIERESVVDEDDYSGKTMKTVDTITIINRRGLVYELARHYATNPKFISSIENPEEDESAKKTRTLELLEILSRDIRARRESDKEFMNGNKTRQFSFDPQWLENSNM